MTKKTIVRKVLKPVSVLNSELAEQKHQIKIYEQFLKDTYSGIEAAEYQLAVARQNVDELETALKKVVR